MQPDRHGTVPAELRFATYLAPRMMPVYQAVADAVGRALGCRTVLVAEPSHDNWAKDEYDICFVCGLPYVDFERRGCSPAIPVAAPVLAGSRYGGRPIYFSDVIVRRGSVIRSLDDLRGRSWGYTDLLSQSGYGIARYSLLNLGETQGFFGQVIKTGGHLESIALVAAGEIDGSAIDSQVLAVAMADDAALADELTIVTSLGPSTIQPVTVSKRLSPELRARITDVIVSIHHDPSGRERLSSGLVERFVRVGPDSYDDIRAMLDACQEAHFMTLS
ncbi:MAG TPA: PhnD/SsuA/transferrin family substrate-binding protein [Streptosporangiaceae bacterium]